jgi:hypothetical protein
MERLEGEVPGWFVEQDANGDGQVAMAEYARFWSDSKAREFARYDRNHDGLITPRECLAAKVEGAYDEASADSAKSDGDDDGDSAAWWMSP